MNYTQFSLKIGDVFRLKPRKNLITHTVFSEVHINNMNNCEIYTP